MTSNHSPLHSLPSTLFWTAVAAASLFVIARVGDDYLTSIRSLQELRWRVARFEPPAPDAAETVLLLEVQNRSRLDLTLINPEIYLWYGIDTVGKTYGYNQTRTIASGTNAQIPFTLIVNSTEYAKARARTAPTANVWRLTGSYKVTTPLTDFDLLYRLQLDPNAP